MLAADEEVQRARDRPAGDRLLHQRVPAEVTHAARRSSVNRATWLAPDRHPRALQDLRRRAEGGARLRPGRSHRRGRGVRVAPRPLGLRQVHSHADDRRPARRHVRRGPGRRRDGYRPAHRHRHHVPGQHAGALAQRARATSRCSSNCAASIRRPMPRASSISCTRSGSTAFVERYPYELSGGMQQRAAFCQAHGPRARHAAAGRAARQARRHDAREHPQRPADAVDGAAPDRRLRHPLDRGGGAAFLAGCASSRRARDGSSA